MRRLIDHRLLLPIVALLLAVVGCKPTVPSDYLSPSEMEDILYDYHLAVAMAQNSNASDMQRKSWQLAVLKKHGVSEQEFDRSMAYYMRHTERMQTIYEHLADRMGQEARSLGASDAELSQYGSIASRGDTTNVWPGRKTLMLSTFAPYNKYTFELKVDTAYHKGDRLVLSYDAFFLLQEGMRNLTVGLIVTFANDSTVQQVQEVASDMRQTLSVEDRDSIGIKRVRGFFLLGRNAPPPTTTLTLFFAENVKLVRIHPQKGQPWEDSSNPMNPSTPIRNVGSPSAPDRPGPPDQQPGAPELGIPEPTAPQRGTPQPPIPVRQLTPQPQSTSKMRPMSEAGRPMKSMSSP